ncbi:hypothetical protein [Halorubrum cibi]|uniref:DUF7961 domain-containing protein n=1 Tax=Halorubrum cibi TaxID=413815 RepID=A0A521E5L7_9EURY|nr:hypothetical protein [Halorubrum cibi]SMO78450.1 hypothetical protein SAMN06264867_10918 [Halorubrum cibi]
MSTTEPRGVDAAIEGCRPAEIEPIVVDAADLESTAPEYLRDFKSGLSARGYHPSALSVAACFADDCPLAAGEEADRLRGFVRAAAFLGAGRIEVRLDEVADPDAVEPTLSALAERARREGIEFVRVDATATNADRPAA